MVHILNAPAIDGSLVLFSYGVLALVIIKASFVNDIVVFVFFIVVAIPHEIFLKCFYEFYPTRVLHEGLKPVNIYTESQKHVITKRKCR